MIWGNSEMTKRVILGLCLALLLNASSIAQSSKQGGRLSGVVLDVNDARVFDAKVTVRARNFTREVFTDETGQFTINLPAGEYSLTVQANGFCQFEGEALKIISSTTEMINVHLEVMDNDSRNPCKCTSRSARR